MDPKKESTGELFAVDPERRQRASSPPPAVQSSELDEPLSILDLDLDAVLGGMENESILDE